jgi:hypothetical protein
MPMLTPPLPAAHPFAEVRHAVEDLVYLGHDVDPADHERALAGHPERDMKDGAILGHVDPLAGEHRVAPPWDLTRARELHEQV